PGPTQFTAAAHADFALSEAYCHKSRLCCRAKKWKITIKPGAVHRNQPLRASTAGASKRLKPMEGRYRSRDFPRSGPINRRWSGGKTVISTKANGNTSAAR